jgi:AraC-like DNA-binding protein
MKILADARIVVWEGASLWIVEATPGDKDRRTDFHAHHAIQISISLGGWFTLDTARTSVRGDAVAVAADASHIYGAEGLTAFLFIEPESRAGRAVARQFLAGTDLAVVPPERLGDFRQAAAAAWRHPKRDDAALIELGRSLTQALAAEVRADIPDHRVRKMISWATRHIGDPISLADAGSIGGLSMSRLRHLFVEQTGLPFKTYLLWLRLTRAIEGLAAGASITQAAHEAGFADSAHLSRTFRRMFGVSPTALRMT